jgi:hypothetical protein
MKAHNELPQSAPRARGRGVFLIGVSILSVTLAVGIWQVPQPWRGYLIGWLLFAFPIFLLVLRFMSHYYRMREIEMMTGKKQDVAYTIQREPKRVGDSVKVIEMNTRKGGRQRL